MGFRIETDSLGEIQVPANRYYGAQTERARSNFRIGTEVLPRSMIRALGLVKKAAARANEELGELSRERREWIVAAADEVISGDLDDEFPLVIWQTGSGTQSNMNANEVIANRAIEFAGGTLGSKDPVHPNDHVNRSQSSNDVIPAAMHIAAVETLVGDLDPAVNRLIETLDSQVEAFADRIKIGRTHLMDAVPITFGQEVSGWASQLRRGLRRVAACRDELLELPLGGTAVGTGLNCNPRFGPMAIAAVAAETGQPFRVMENRFAGIGAHDAMVATSGALHTLAVALMKIANDIRLLASGPRAGLGELRLPQNEPGSSIMPGKVNPTQCEALTMVCAQVMGNDAAVHIGGMSGHLQLNAFKPLILFNVLHSIQLLAEACTSFDRHCVRGLEPVPEVMDQHLTASLMLVTALAPKIGYDAAARVAKTAFERGSTLREAAVDLGVLDGAAFDAIVRPETMVGRPPISEE